MDDGERDGAARPSAAVAADMKREMIRRRRSRTKSWIRREIAIEFVAENVLEM